MSLKLKPVTQADILNAPIADILQACQLTKWHVLIVGDGSGNSVDNPCGWSSVLIDYETKNRRLFGGHANAGSVTFAESMPFIQAITWYDHFYGQHLNKNRLELCDVHIVTDSQTTANMGNQAVTAQRESRAMLYLTSCVQAYMKLKYRFTWHWLPRNQYQLTELVDRLSKQHRVNSLNLDNKTLPKH